MILNCIVNLKFTHMVQRTKIIGILLLILLFVSAIVLFSLLPSGPRDIEKIQKSGEIRIAVRMNQIDCMMRGDTMAGFQYELARQFAYMLESGGCVCRMLPKRFVCWKKGRWI